MSLVTYARYVAITDDTTSPAASATAALVDAQDLLELELNRRGYLEDTGADFTERLRIFNDARLGYVVYPSGLPITDEGDLTAHGALLAGAGPDASPAFGIVSGEQYATITYRGGYTSSTVPVEIERDIAWAAYSLLRPASATSVPAGATSVRLGDAAVTYAAPRSAAEAGIRWSRAALRHRRRRL